MIRNLLLSALVAVGMGGSCTVAAVAAGVSSGLSMAPTPAVAAAR